MQFLADNLRIESTNLFQSNIVGGDLETQRMRFHAEVILNTHSSFNVKTIEECIEQMSKPCSKGGIWSDALIMKYISLYFYQSLNFWDTKAVLEESTTTPSLSYQDDIDLKNISLIFLMQMIIFILCCD